MKEICRNCHGVLVEDASFCVVCNFPLKGSESEQASFVAKQVSAKIDVKDSLQKVKTARWILFIVGAFYLVVSFLPIPEAGSMIALGVNLMIGGFFVFFGFLSYKAPLASFLVPLILIFLYFTLLLVISPFTLLNGIAIKMAVLVGLIYAFLSVRKANKILKENPYLKAVIEREGKQQSN